MRINSGDVIEFEGQGGPITALVLLVSDSTLIVDLLDDDVPYLVSIAELTGLKVFDPVVEQGRTAEAA